MLINPVPPASVRFVTLLSPYPDARNKFREVE
jgi:hypothetical protein